MSPFAQTVMTSREVEMRETRSGLRSMTVMSWPSPERHSASAEPIFPAPTMMMFMRAPSTRASHPTSLCGHDDRGARAKPSYTNGMHILWQPYPKTHVVVGQPRT